MAKVIGVKFRNSAKLYYFAPNKEHIEKGDNVVVETARGVEFATVCHGVIDVDDDKVVQPLKPVLRKATKKDIERFEANIAKIPETKKVAEERIAAHKLKMKLIDVEFTFDGSKVIFYFTAAGRIDFRELVRDLASIFHLRIELRQIGIRDETKILGGIAPCGRACCCASCMPDFRKVTIKMAKVQGLSLNPGKISGLCGRLMCCLEYENDYYSQVYKKMPKIGSTVTCPDGTGIVIGNNMLKFLVKIRIENHDGSLLYKEYPLDAVTFKKSSAGDDVKLTKEEQEELKGLESDE